MLDMNGIELRTGQVIEITGAFCKSQDGRYVVIHSPGDPGWTGSGHGLAKLSASGKIEPFGTVNAWPLQTYIADARKVAEADAWNKAHARIEVKTIDDMADVAAYFRDAADRMTRIIRDLSSCWRSGEDDTTVKSYRQAQAHYRAVARDLA